MPKIKAQVGYFVDLLERSLPLMILAALLFCTYLKFSAHPYQGFRLNSYGKVSAIYLKELGVPTLEIGDQIIRVGTTPWIDFQSNLRKPFFQEIQPGLVVPLLVEREKQQITINWKFPDHNEDELTDLLINEGWLSFVFWLAGTVTLLSLRPKNQLWRLMLWFNYLTALWLVVGSGLSFYHISGSAIILRILIWLSVPVYLHLHLVYPEPFRKFPTTMIWGIYIFAIGLALAEWFQALPLTLYLLGFFVAIIGSILLLIAHAIWQPTTRRDLRLVLLVVLLAFSPALLIGFLGAFSSIPFLAGAGTIGMPFLSWVYFYTASRRQLGDLEVRVNRLISGYLFLVAIATIFLVLMTLPNARIIQMPENASFSGITIVVGFIVAILSAGLSIWLFPVFQNVVERRLLGIKLVPAQLQEIYSARITMSTSFATLKSLIVDDILPSLLVREFMFLQFDELDNAPKIFCAIGVLDHQLPRKADVLELLTYAGSYRPLAVLQKNDPCPWVRLALPLKIGDKLMGLWLFGRRDPDDIYSQVEIPTLKSLANQMAIAQSNILQTDRLKSLYLLNVERHEEERLRLALELHDSVLNRIAALTMSFDSPPPLGFQENYEKLTQDVREIVKNLRPAMLGYGLKLAIEELVENLAENPRNVINITSEVVGNNERYPQNIEQHLYRIIQEACSNAIRHAQAANIHISGQLDPDKISLKVADDGVGFQAGENLDTLLINKHFGLAGMKERAELIGAEFRIESNPKAGSSIFISWENYFLPDQHTQAAGLLRD